MNRRTTLPPGLLTILAFALFALASAQTTPPYVQYLPLIMNPLSAPTLKWQRLGCYSSWCETGWYSSPAVVNLDADPQLEIVASAYSIWALDGDTGNILWQTRSGHDTRENFESVSNVGRTWPGVVVANVDGAGQPEIVTAHSGGWVAVYDLNGRFKPGWPQRPTTAELRGLLAADLDGDGSSLEIIVTAAVGSKTNTWVYNANGALRGGWPQLTRNDGYAWGVYNANGAAGNLDASDARLELVIPSDVHYIQAYRPDGASLQAGGVYGGKTWGQVGVWESAATELRGWGACDGVRAESYRANFADGPAVIADVNGDGTREVVVVGNMVDCKAGYPPSRYMALFLFNPDRTRFKASGFDWTSIPVDTGAPIAEDYNVIESAEPNPAVADLDGDGRQEMLFASYDGRVHAFWLDKSEHGSWPYAVFRASEGLKRFASEPVVADLDCDGKAEVLFTSWVQEGSNQTGKIHLLNYLGQVIAEVPLPAGFNASWNGAMAAPTLANVDSDPQLEAVINSAHSGVLVYDLPGSGACNLQWPTGRGNLGRTGSR
jgi:hypothetical protein